MMTSTRPWKKRFNKYRRTKDGVQFLDQKKKNVIGTMWVFRNKLDENGEFTKKRQDQFARDMHEKKKLTMERHLPLLQDWKD